MFGYSNGKWPNLESQGPLLDPQANLHDILGHKQDHVHLDALHSHDCSASGGQGGLYLVLLKFEENTLGVFPQIMRNS